MKPFGAPITSLHMHVSAINTAADGAATSPNGRHRAAARHDAKWLNEKSCSFNERSPGTAAAPL